ncbi:MAG: hypothetical protein WD035_07610 [Balneolaceae bacterium]
MAKHLGLDLSKVMDSNGSLIEEGIVIEQQESLYPFDEEYLFQDDALRHNDEVAWPN